MLGTILAHDRARDAASTAAWKLVRRASGHDQKKGVLERIFVISMVIAGIAFFVWFLVIQGPGPDLAPRRVRRRRRRPHG